MANTVAVTKLVEGPRSAYFHVYLKSDGGSGDLDGYTLLDPAVDFDPAQGGGGMRMSLRKVWYSFAGFDLLFKFDATTDFPIWVLSADAGAYEHCFDEFGGFQDRSGIDASGKLLISTSGFTTTADQGSMVIKVNKTYKPYVAA